MPAFKYRFKNPHVSVCIPAYNASLFIEKTIRSVLNSTYSELEVIVCDDCSTDDTVNIVKNIKDKRLRLIENSSHFGVPKNWNRAFKYAEGEFIGLLNHDDIYGPFWLTFVVNALKKNPQSGWAASAFYVINENDKPIRYVNRFPETGEYDLKETFLCVAKLNGLSPGIIVRKEALEEVGSYDEKAGPSADNDLCLRLASRFPLYYSNYPHTSWRLHKRNLTYRWPPIQQAEDGFRMLEKIFNYDRLPPEIKKYKNRCFEYFHSKVETHAEQLKKKGDIESYQKIRALLKAKGNIFK